MNESLMVTFLIPNRDDPEKPPTLYDTWGTDAVPRQGEEVWFSRGDAAAEGWIVKWVRYTFTRGEVPPKIEVRLLEPGHWSLS